MKLFTRELEPVNDPLLVYNINAVIIEGMQSRPNGFASLALLAIARDQYTGSAPVELERSIDKRNRDLLDCLYKEYGAVLIETTPIDDGAIEQTSYMVGTYLPLSDVRQPVRVVELHGRTRPSFKAVVAPLH